MQSVAARSTSTHSRRAVIRLAAMPLNAKACCITRYAYRDLGNLVRCALAAGIHIGRHWGEHNAPVLCIAAEWGSVRALRALLAGGAHHSLEDARACQSKRA